MAHIRRISVALLAIVALLAAGCTFGPTRLEADYGNSYSLAKFQQLLDPTAVRNLEPVYGFDGIAAAATMERYHEKFRKPPPPPQFVISVGEIGR